MLVSSLRVSAFRTRWAPSQNCLIFSPHSQHVAHKGDIVVFTFSHIGIVERGGNGALHTIEGNTNAEGSREGTTCRRKQRSLAQVRCLIRLPVVVGYDEDQQVCLMPQETTFDSLTSM